MKNDQGPTMGDLRKLKDGHWLLTMAQPCIWIALEEMGASFFVESLKDKVPLAEGVIPNITFSEEEGKLIIQFAAQTQNLMFDDITLGNFVHRTQKYLESRKN